MTTRAGFVGLGSIGRPMARRLCAGGLATWVFVLVPAAVDELVAAGATRADSARAVAAVSDVVGVCVQISWPRISLPRSLRPWRSVEVRAIRDAVRVQ